MELFGWDFGEVVQENAGVFWIVAFAFIVFVLEAEVFWRLREAKNVDTVVFVGGIVE